MVVKPQKKKKKNGYFWEETRQTFFINQKFYFRGLKANHDYLCFRGLSRYHWKYNFGFATNQGIMIIFRQTGYKPRIACYKPRKTQKTTNPQQTGVPWLVDKQHIQYVFFRL